MGRKKEGKNHSTHGRCENASREHQNIAKYFTFLKTLDYLYVEDLLFLTEYQTET